MSKNRSNNGLDGPMGTDAFRDGDDLSRTPKKYASRGRRKRSVEFAEKNEENLDDGARFIDSESFDSDDSAFVDSEVVEEDEEIEYFDAVSDDYLRRSFLYDADSVEDDLDGDFDDDFDEDFEELSDDEFNELVPEIDDDGEDEIVEELVESDPSDDFDEMAADEDVYDGDE